ncbi:PucR family transcriptional regulator [Mycobacterium sp. NAZ190054]|uniref:PucR family transcriptional regulator n=1 Tax=Mycobacterium sp. NAZ190054 TaxID=1747766 RepID=UPI001E38D411|nr:PucR family transcriptional regulator [Mycobacterium sp. NAZ190054]
MLADTGLALVPVHTPRPEQAVRWVATSELPDPAPFFEGGEILLTTGLQTKRWSREWVRYVRGLADAGIPALGFATGLTFAAPPAALVEACATFGLNLFEVPRATPFVAISHRVSRMLADEEEASARGALKVQRTLTASAAGPQGALGVLKALAKILAGSACIVAADGRVALGPVGERQAAMSAADLATEVRRLHQRGPRSAATLSNAAGTTVLQPLGVSGRRTSFLAALGPERFSGSQRSAITTAVALLSLISEQERTAAETRRRLRSRAVELAVAGDAETAQLVLGIEPEMPPLPSPMRVIRAGGTAAQLADASSLLDERRALAAGGDDEVCVITADSDRAALTAELCGAGLLVGVGRRTGIRDAPESHRTAGIALAQATPAAAIAEWDHIFRQGPLGLMDPGDARSFAESYLGRLDTEQLDLLRCYLRNHGSRLKVAEEMGLHRNTIRNRLDAIAERLPGPLDDPQTRVSAWIALQTMDSRPRRGQMYAD